MWCQAPKLDICYTKLMQSYDEWIKEGILPGPGETEEQYRERAHYCLNLRNSFKDLVDTGFQDQVLEPVTEEGLNRVERLYGIRSTWIPFFFSNYRLPFWQGGCAWIFQQTVNSPVSAFFQLRQVFRKQNTYLGIYPRDELVAHELCHVGRMAYEEPRYEELLAYRTSKSPFRRYWGPLFTTPAQSGIFALLLLLILMADLITLFFQPDLYGSIQWMKVLPLVWIGWLIFDLMVRQRIFKKCLHILPEKILYRLTDREIDLFSKMTLDEILEYGKKEGSLRWKVLYQSMTGGINSETKLS